MFLSARSKERENKAIVRWISLFSSGSSRSAIRTRKIKGRANSAVCISSKATQRLQTVDINRWLTIACAVFHQHALVYMKRYHLHRDRRQRAWVEL